MIYIYIYILVNGVVVVAAVVVFSFNEHSKKILLKARKLKKNKEVEVYREFIIQSYFYYYL